MSYELGFIGGGNMAEAIAQAALDGGVLPAEAMIVSDPSGERQAAFADMGVAATGDNARVIRESRQVMVAVKPQVMAEAAADLGRHGRGDQVVISIMAGVRSSRLAEAAGRRMRVVRVMPNTPVMAGAGMAGVSLGENAQPGDESLAMRVFEAGGRAVRVDESLLDAVTAVSGSGPAYAFYLAEAMERAAAELGLSEHARLLVVQTIHGAAQLMMQSGEAPAELRRKVTSPGGTTEAAIRHLEGSGVMQVMIDAIEAAHQRSIELGG